MRKLERPVNFDGDNRTAVSQTTIGLQVKFIGNGHRDGFNDGRSVSKGPTISVVSEWNPRFLLISKPPRVILKPKEKKTSRFVIKWNAAAETRYKLSRRKRLEHTKACNECQVSNSGSH